MPQESFQFLKNWKSAQIAAVQYVKRFVVYLNECANFSARQEKERMNGEKEVIGKIRDHVTSLKRSLVVQQKTIQQKLQAGIQ
jgi:hypothetical protein